MKPKCGCADRAIALVGALAVVARKSEQGWIGSDSLGLTSLSDPLLSSPGRPGYTC